MANFSPSFLEIKRNGLKTRRILKIFNLSRLFPSKTKLINANITIIKSNIFHAFKI